MARPGKARRAVTRLVQAYGDAVTRRDAGVWGSLWTEDATWILGPREVAGRERVVELWKSAMSQLPFVVHVAFPAGLEIAGDEGSGRWYVQEILTTESGGAELVFGVYNDRYRLLAGEWRFARRRFDLLFRSPLPAGWKAETYPEVVDLPFAAPRERDA